MLPPRLIRRLMLAVPVLLLVALFNLFQSNSTRGPQQSLAFSDFLSDVNRGQVADVTIQGNNIGGHFTDGRAFSTYAPNDPNLVSKLTDKGVRGCVDEGLVVEHLIPRSRGAQT